MTFPLRVALLGCPSRPDLAWSEENVAKIKTLGFNALQLNIAWGARPADEPLCLEDVIDLPADAAQWQSRADIPWRADTRPERVQARRDDLRARSRLAKAMGMKTIFHFGAPNIGLYAFPMSRWTEELPRCVSDPNTHLYYAALLGAFAREYPDVDDVLLYTFDQDAWVCSEFGSCPRCGGVPLHERIVPFVEGFARVWREHRPEGRVWWEPWELSAGQVLRSVERIEPTGFGLMLHSNIAEVMAALPVDRWLKNTVALATRRGIPVCVEHFLGGPSEELESFEHLSHPLVTWRGLQTISQVPGVSGIKEYFGLLPDKEDPNLRATALFFADPSRPEDEMLRELSQIYGAASEAVQEFWRQSSAAFELFPWDASWSIRRVGNLGTGHGLHAAKVNGFVADSPSWHSTRGAIYIQIDNAPPHPWLREDVQLRCEQSAETLRRAIERGESLEADLPLELRPNFARNLDELRAWERVARAIALYLRASNLAFILRARLNAGQPVPPHVRDELSRVLEGDLELQSDDTMRGALREALETLRRSPEEFVGSYFRADKDHKLPTNNWMTT